MGARHPSALHPPRRSAAVGAPATLAVAPRSDSLLPPTHGRPSSAHSRSASANAIVSVGGARSDRDAAVGRVSSAHVPKPLRVPALQPPTQPSPASTSGVWLSGLGPVVYRSPAGAAPASGSPAFALASPMPMPRGTIAPARLALSSMSSLASRASSRAASTDNDADAWSTPQALPLTVPPLSPPSSTAASMFDVLAVIGPSMGTVRQVHHNAGGASATPQKLPVDVLARVPETEPLPTELIGGFCFPDGATSTAVQSTDFAAGGVLEHLFGVDACRRGPCSHTFVLTGSAAPNDDAPANVTRYCLAFRTLHPVHVQDDVWHLVPRVFCMVSRFPFFRPHFEVLRAAVLMWRIDVMNATFEALEAHSGGGRAPADASARGGAGTGVAAAPKPLASSGSASSSQQWSQPRYFPSGADEEEKKREPTADDDLEQSAAPHPPAGGLFDVEGSGSTAAGLQLPARVQSMLLRYRSLAVPRRGDSLQFTVGTGLNPVHFTRAAVSAPAPTDANRDSLPHGVPISDWEAAHELRQWTVPVLFSVLPVEAVLVAIGALLAEKKVLVVGEHLEETSSVVLALVSGS